MKNMICKLYMCVTFTKLNFRTCNYYSVKFGICLSILTFCSLIIMQLYFIFMVFQYVGYDSHAAVKFLMAPTGLYQQFKRQIFITSKINYIVDARLTWFSARYKGVRYHHSDFKGDRQQREGKIHLVCHYHWSRMYAGCFWVRKTYQLISKHMALLFNKIPKYSSYLFSFSYIFLRFSITLMSTSQSNFVS